MSHHTRKSLNSQVILSLAPGYLKSLWKVEQLQQEGLRAAHPQRGQRHGQDAAEEAGDVGFPRGVKQLALRRPHLVRDPQPGDTEAPASPRILHCVLLLLQGAPTAGGEQATVGVC